MPSLRRNAIITGAASGLGRALALRLARDGWHIAICDLNDAGSAETLRLVEAAGGSGQVEHLNVTNPDEWESLRDRLQAQWGQLDLLVNNAGVAGAGDVGKFSLADWRWIIDINLFNGIYGCHYFVDWLKQNPRGAHIINTASMAGIASAPGMAGYNVSKAGMVSLSETLYAELLPHNVGVTVICPEFFATNLLKEGRWAQDNLKKVAERAFEVSKLTADQVADRAVKAMHRKRLYVLAPFGARARWWFKRATPQMFMTQVSKLLNSAARVAALRLAKEEGAGSAQPANDREPVGRT